MKRAILVLSVVAAALGALALPVWSEPDALICGPDSAAGSTVQALSADAVSRAMALLRHTC